MDLLHTTFLGAAATGIVALYSQIRSVIDRFIGLFIVKFVINEDAAEAVNAYLWKNGKALRWGPRYFSSYVDVIKRKRTRQVIPVEHIAGSTTLFLIKKKLLWVKGDEHAESAARQARRINISFFRWTFKPEKFIEEAVNNLNEIRKGKTNRFRIFYKSGMGNRKNYGNGEEYLNKSGGESLSQPTTQDESEISRLVYQGGVKLIGYNLDEIGSVDASTNPFDTFCFDEKVQNAIKEIEFWKNSEAWFKDRFIPWRRGWLLDSPPGCGKTTLVRCIGMYFDLPVIVFDLASMSNKEFEHAWDSLAQHTPCIALIEDVDRVFDKDINVVGEQGGGLSFDKLLNCISGIKVCDGVFTIITTNHMDKVDPALGITQDNGISTRPGRMDRILKIGKPDENCRRKIACRILDRFPSEIESIVMLGSEDTVAQFQDRCCQRALQLFWAGYNK